MKKPLVVIRVLLWLPIVAIVYLIYMLLIFLNDIIIAICKAIMFLIVAFLRDLKMVGNGTPLENMIEKIEQDYEEHDRKN
jgi:hypothetical protein